MPSIIGPKSIPIPPPGVDLSGFSIDDPFAAGNPGRMSVTVSVQHGAVSMAGHPAAALIKFAPTLAEANAALATLRYVGAGPDTVTIDVWNQAGVEYACSAQIGGPAPTPAPLPAAETQARRARAFNASIAVNTHIDFGSRKLVPQYEDRAALAAAIRYLWENSGTTPLLRDSPFDASAWAAVAADAGGARFIAYVGESSPDGYQGYVDRALALPAGLVACLEGPNEPDSATSNGLTPGMTEQQSLAAAAAYMRQLAPIAKAKNLPLINMSFGRGWTADNQWHGNYDKVGDLSAFCDFANAHTYPGVDPPRDQVAALNADALLAAPNRPVAITEFGYLDSPRQAEFMLAGIADAIDLGAAIVGWYALCDDMSGTWGLFGPDWTPRPSAAALRNLMAVMADAAVDADTFLPGRLTYSLTRCRSLPFQRADGTFLLVAWAEESAVSSQLTLGEAAAIDVLDPAVGVAPVRSVASATFASVDVPTWPIVLRIG